MMPYAFALPLLLPLVAFAGDDAGDNPVFKQLVREGIAVDSRSVKLPEPALAPTADAKRQTEVVHRIASKKHNYDDFVRKSPVAPFALELNTVGDDSAERGQTVDLWFVAYGKLDDLSSNELFRQIVAGGESKNQRDEPQDLSDDALRRRGLKVESSDDRQESYYRMDASVLDKVRVAGIAHGVVTRGRNHILAASLLDPRFADDQDFPNQWRPIHRDTSGKTSLGKPHSYAGLGGYCQAVELHEPRGALFIECHLVIDEPHGWFNGANLLRSKLPIVMQDNVRTLRRKLAR